MLEKLKLTGILLAVPLLGVLVLGLVAGKMEDNWQEALGKNMEGISAEARSEFTLTKACSMPDLSKGLEDVCETQSRVGLIRRLSVWTGVTSLAFMLLVTTAGLIARKNRNWLLWTFAPGLHVCNAVVSIAVIVQGIILIAVVWYGETAVAGRVHVKLILLVALAAVLGAVGILRSSFGVVKRAKATVLGKLATAKEYPGLWEFISSVSRKVGTEPPQHLIIGLEPNFFVTEADVHCLDGDISGRSMYISAPLCRILSRSEVEAILAHEYGHFSGADTKFSLKFYPIYRGAYQSLQGVAEAAAASGTGGLALIPAMHLLAFFVNQFAAAENKISRDREIAADSVAATATTPVQIATGLVKVVAFSDAWGQVVADMKQALDSNQPIEIGDEMYDPSVVFSNLSEVYSGCVGAIASQEMLEGLDSKVIPHPTDSHPPLSVRLSALRCALKDVAEGALNVRPDEPASSLIDGIESLESELTIIQQCITNPNSVQKRLGQGSASDAPSRAADDQLPQSRIQQCCNCGTRVLPTPEGACPACRVQLPSADRQSAEPRYRANTSGQN